MKIKNIILEGSKTLKEVGIESFMLDSQLMLALVLERDKSFVILNPDFEVADSKYDSFCKLLARRANREPLQYIINKCEFFGLDFYVDENVLIPRADTETLVEQVLSESAACRNILEIGVGSGAISVSLGKHLPNIRIAAIDISEKALKIAEKNANNNDVNNIEFVHADIFNWKTKEKFNAIVSNPPYIESKVCDGLQAEVANYEPRIALDGGDDGLDFYKGIAGFAAGHLAEGGFIALEIGQGQECDIEGIFKENGFILKKSKKDLAGIIRVLILGEKDA